jgi:CelD/BcsL family acetyltransferase involved in cellulose biosynthesis
LRDKHLGPMSSDVTEHVLLGNLAGPWDRLVERLPVPTPFLRSWWLEATARGDPCFAMVMDGTSLLGGIALQEERRRGISRFRAMGSGPLCPDHVDLVVDPDHETVVAESLRGWLRREGSRVLDLEGVESRGRIATVLPGVVRRDVITVAPWMPVPHDAAEYLATRSPNFQANLRKAKRRLASEGATHRVVPPERLDDGLETLAALHANRGPSNFLVAFDLFAAASRAGAARGEFVLHELAVGETVVASLACFDVAGRVSLYQSGRATEHRWRSALTVLLYEVIEDASRLGRTEVDFLRGDEPYKRTFADRRREIVRLRAATGAAGRATLLASIVSERARAAAASARRNRFARASSRAQ